MTKDKKLIIIGAGEFAEIAFEYFTHDSSYSVEAFSVDAEFIKEDTLNSLPVVPLEGLLEEYPPSLYEVFVAVTYTKLNRVRADLYNRLKSMGYKCATYISSRAFVWHNAQIGDNCFIFEDNTIQPFTQIGDNVIMWSGNHLGHRSIIKDNCFISSHVVISGYCDIGENTFIGVNTTLADNVKIGKDNLIGAGSVVLKSTEDAKIYQGNPAEPSRVSSLRYFKIKE